MIIFCNKLIISNYWFFMPISLMHEYHPLMHEYCPLMHGYRPLMLILNKLLKKERKCVLSLPHNFFNINLKNFLLWLNDYFS